MAGRLAGKVALVSGGANTPPHSVKSKFLMPLASATVGISGADGARVADDTASNLSEPAFISGVTAGKPGKYISTCAPTRSLSAGPAPL